MQALARRPGAAAAALNCVQHRTPSICPPARRSGGSGQAHVLRAAPPRSLSQRMQQVPLTSAPPQQQQQAAGAPPVPQQQAQPAQQSWWRRLVGGGAQQQEELATDLLRTVSEAELTQLLAACDAGGPPLVVVFSAHWCGPCQLLAKQLTASAKQLRAGPAPNLTVVKVEAPDESALASRLGVHALPCTFVVGGRGPSAPALRFEGVLKHIVIEDAVLAKARAAGSDLLRAVKL